MSSQCPFLASGKKERQQDEKGCNHDYDEIRWCFQGNNIKERIL